MYNHKYLVLWNMEEGEEKKKSRLNATFYYDFPSFSKQIVSPFYYHNTFGGQ